MVGKQLQNTISSFQQKGYRITRTRSLAVEIFQSLKAPISAPELLGLLEKQELKVNKTTIYRELDFLQKAGFIREIDLLDGSKRYELIKPNDHHHHLICTSCKNIQCVSLPNDLDAIEKSISQKHKFKITGHVLEFFGLCSDCR